MSQKCKIEEWNSKGEREKRGLPKSLSIVFDRSTHGHGGAGNEQVESEVCISCRDFYFCQDVIKSMRNARFVAFPNACLKQKTKQTVNVRKKIRLK